LLIFPNDRELQFAILPAAQHVDEILVWSTGTTQQADPFYPMIPKKPVRREVLRKYKPAMP